MSGSKVAVAGADAPTCRGVGPLGVVLGDGPHDLLHPSLAAIPAEAAGLAEVATVKPLLRNKVGCRAAFGGDLREGQLLSRRG